MQTTVMPVQFKTIQFDEKFTFDLLQQDRDTLLVTIGDSWTWGHGISMTRWEDGVVIETDSEKHTRLESVFGMLIANKINADFLNLSYPGQSNGWIAEYFDQFIAQYKSKMDYKKVIVIITMSEVAREWLGEFDPPVNYYEFCDDITSIDDFFARQSKKIADKITSTQKKITHDDLPVKVIKAIGFVEDNYPRGFIDCGKTWQEVLCEEGGTPYEKNKLYLCQTLVVEKLDTYLMEYNHHAFDKTGKIKKQYPSLPIEIYQEQRSSLLDKIDKFNDLIYNSKTNTWRSKEDRGHPSAEGHKIWANYLIEQIN